MSEPTICFDHVCKRFRLGESHDSLRDLIAHGLGRLLGRAVNRRSHFWALQDVSFAVVRGDTLGIIGPNGAGKSTALKLLAGILRPNSGRVSVYGRLAALIEVGAGFHGDLTGRENIFLNGAILGMSRAEVRQKLDAIVAFAGIEPFLETPVKRYSSGMYARLGFSIAAHVEADVLLVDEVLSVGDAVFRLRCLERMRELVRGGTTLVFVTHDLDQMQSICSRAIVLDHGATAFDGPAREAVGQYLHAMSRAFAERSADIEPAWGGGAVELLSLRWVGAVEKEFVSAGPRDAIRAELRFRVRRPIAAAVVELNLRSAMNEPLVSLNSGRDGVTFKMSPGERCLTLRLASLPLAGGQYFWNVRLWNADLGVIELDTPFRYPMILHDDGRATGALCVEHSWSSDANDAPLSEPALAESIS